PVAHDYATKNHPTKKGARRPPNTHHKTRPQRLLLSAAAAGADELGVGLHATFRHVHSLVLLLLADADTHHCLDDAPHDQAGDKHPDEDRECADDLAGEAGAAVFRER